MDDTFKCIHDLMGTRWLVELKTNHQLYMYKY